MANYSCGILPIFPTNPPISAKSSQSALRLHPLFSKQSDNPRPTRTFHPTSSRVSAKKTDSSRSFFVYVNNRLPIAHHYLHENAVKFNTGWHLCDFRAGIWLSMRVRMRARSLRCAPLFPRYLYHGDGRIVGGCGMPCCLLQDQVGIFGQADDGLL